MQLVKFFWFLFSHNLSKKQNARGVGRLKVIVLMFSHWESAWDTDDTLCENMTAKWHKLAKQGMSQQVKKQFNSTDLPHVFNFFCADI